MNLDRILRIVYRADHFGHAATGTQPDAAAAAVAWATREDQMRIVLTWDQPKRTSTPISWVIRDVVDNYIAAGGPAEGIQQGHGNGPTCQGVPSGLQTPHLRRIMAGPSAGSWDIWDLDLQTGAYRQITTEKGSETNPRWSPRMVNTFRSTRTLGCKQSNRKEKEV